MSYNGFLSMATARFIEVNDKASMRLKDKADKDYSYFVAEAERIVRTLEDSMDTAPSSAMPVIRTCVDNARNIGFLARRLASEAGRLSEKERCGLLYEKMSACEYSIEQIRLVR